MENPVRMKVHPNFKDLCYSIQNERVKIGKEEVKNKLSHPKISKMIVNMINANPKMFDALVGVENGKI